MVNSVCCYDLLCPPTFLTTFSQHFEVSDVISNHLLHIRMFLYAFECFCSSVYDLHEKKSDTAIFKMEASATAVPSTAAKKQKYKWSDQTVEKLTDLAFFFHRHLKPRPAI